jgi:hypothetical protein
MNSPTGTPPRKRFFLIWVIAGSFILFGLMATVFGLREVYRAWDSRTWPAAEGVVRTSSVRHEADAHHSNSPGTQVAEIRYEFTADGRTHSGTRVAFGDYSSSDSAHAQGLVDRYPAGTVVTVHYRPDNPDVCVLEPGVKGQAWFLLIGGLVSLGLGCGQAVLWPWLLRKKAAEREPAMTPQQLAEEIRRVATSVAQGHAAEEFRKVVPPPAERQAAFRNAVRSWSPGARFFLSRVFPLPFILVGLVIIYLWAGGKSVSASWVVLAFGIGFLAAGLMVAILMPRAIRRALADGDAPPANQ